MHDLWHAWHLTGRSDQLELLAIAAEEADDRGAVSA